MQTPCMYRRSHNPAPWEFVGVIVEIGKCLIVEDHPQAQRWLQSALSQAFGEVTVDIAGTLSEGKALVANTYDVALVDIGLPDGNGLELVTPLVATECEVIISSMFAQDSHVLDALKFGAKGYVLKDHSQQELVEMLQGIVGGRPPLSPTIARRVLEYFTQRGEPSAKEAEVSLTERERDVLTLLAKGYTVKAVADLLDISPNTAAGYAKTIYKKLNVTSRAEATLEANRLGFVR